MILKITNIPIKRKISRKHVLARAKNSADRLLFLPAVLPPRRISSLHHRLANTDKASDEYLFEVKLIEIDGNVVSSDSSIPAKLILSPFYTVRFTDVL